MTMKFIGARTSRNPSEAFNQRNTIFYNNLDEDYLIDLIYNVQIAQPTNLMFEIGIATPEKNNPLTPITDSFYSYEYLNETYTAKTTFTKRLQRIMLPKGYMLTGQVIFGELGNGFLRNEVNFSLFGIPHN